MKHAIVAGFAIVLAASSGTTASAACSGGVGSTTLSCETTSGTLFDYKSWIDNIYVPAAVDKAMSTYKDNAFDPNTLGQAGYSQVIDVWGKDAYAQFKSQYWWNPSATQTVTTPKSVSQFLIDGMAWKNGANIFVDIHWTGTIAETVAGVTNYFGTYTYEYRGDAWGQALLNGGTVWPSQNVNGGGSGKYAFTGAVTAVPGPEAGAGLGALVMLGVAYWAKRRRNGLAAAA